MSNNNIQSEYCDSGQETNLNNDEGERGLGTALLIGAGAAVTAVTAYAIYKKTTKKKKKKIKTKKGKTRNIKCDVLVDDKGRELPDQEFDKHGKCINEDEVIEKAANNGQINTNKQENDNINNQSQSTGYTKITKKKKKKIKTKKGKKKKVKCNVLVDEKGHELPDQEFNEHGSCINEEEVIQKAINNGQIQRNTPSINQQCRNEQNNSNEQPSYLTNKQCDYDNNYTTNTQDINTKQNNNLPSYASNAVNQSKNNKNIYSVENNNIGISNINPYC